MNDRKEINEIKEGLKSLVDRLDKLENTIPLPCVPFNYFQVELPEDGERLYCIDYVQSTISSKIFDISNMNDVKRFENGLFFETKEEAEQHLKERKLLFKLHQWAKIKNEGWEPDWEDYNENKYFIKIYVKDKDLWINSSYTCTTYSKLPLFKSNTIAQACIDEFGEEIKEVLVNGS